MYFTYTEQQQKTAHTVVVVHSSLNTTTGLFHRVLFMHRLWAQEWVQVGAQPSLNKERAMKSLSENQG